MPLPIFTPPLEPSHQGSGSTHQVRMRRVAFGDGYEQTAADGINYQRRRLRLIWNNMRQSDANTIVSFLKTNAISGFQYQFPGDTNRQWRIMGDISDDPDTAVTRRVSAEIVEIFDP